VFHRVGDEFGENDDHVIRIIDPGAAYRSMNKRAHHRNGFPARRELVIK